MIDIRLYGWYGSLHSYRLSHRRFKLCKWFNPSWHTEKFAHTKVVLRYFFFIRMILIEHLCYWFGMQVSQGHYLMNCKIIDRMHIYNVWNAKCTLLMMMIGGKKREKKLTRTKIQWSECSKRSHTHIWVNPHCQEHISVFAEAAAATATHWWRHYSMSSETRLNVTIKMCCIFSSLCVRSREFTWTAIAFAFDVVRRCWCCCCCCRCYKNVMFVSKTNCTNKIMFTSHSLQPL